MKKSNTKMKTIYFLLYWLLIGSGCYKGFSQSNSVAALLVLEQKLDQFSAYIQLAEREQVIAKIDSMHQQLFSFPEQFKKNWVELKKQLYNPSLSVTSLFTINAEPVITIEEV